MHCLFAQTESGGSNAALVTFFIYTLAVFVLAWLSSRLMQRKNFVSEYFLGSRGLGVWAFSLTYAATAASGGSFTGCPSLAYTHGWVIAFWFAGYTVVPLCVIGLLAKRINQVARKTGAITIPDVLRDRFHSAGFGMLATLLIVFFMSVNLVAQFKAGSLILSTLLDDDPFFQRAVAGIARLMSSTPLEGVVEHSYLLCVGNQRLN